MLLHNNHYYPNVITPVTAFQATTTRQRPSSTSSRSDTAVHFRNNENSSASNAFVLPTTDSFLHNNDNNSNIHHSASLPAWLSIPRSHLAEANLAALQKAMRGSQLFTESESLQLTVSIEEACDGDRNKVAGAAEFCLLLVETAEMGLDALVAASYHYAACVRVREQQQQHLSSSATTTSKAWLPPLDDATSRVAHNAATSSIVQDAARLKNLEMIAAAVLDKEAGSRVRPDYHDAENLRKLLLSETKDWRALAIRSAACLYRLRGILHQQERTVVTMRTAREALLIYAPLASRLGMHRLKNELEGAAFRILYPRQFKLVNDLTHRHFAGHGDIGDSMKQVLEAVREDMTKMLQDDQDFSRLVENFSVTARVKEPYSLWKKMLRRGYKTIPQVPDALALRIVLDSKKLDPNEDDEVTRARERALCYYAQSLCQLRYKPAADPRIKDYIESPKENGYQSLHYTANTQWHGQDWTLEIQIRSGVMNSIAEFGLAAHFDYKLETSQQQVADVKIKQDGHELDNSSAAYLRNVQEWHWKQHGGTWAADASTPSSSSFPEPGFAIWQSRMRADRIRERNERLEPYIQALKTAQWDLARDFVFIFLSDEHSQVLALPAGACVLDALKSIKREEPNILLNGSATSVTRQLHNGDVLAF